MRQYRSRVARVAIVATAVVGLALPAFAQAEVKYGVEITPFAGYRIGGEFEADEDEDGNKTTIYTGDKLNPDQRRHRPAPGPPVPRRVHAGHRVPHPEPGALPPAEPPGVAPTEAGAVPPINQKPKL